RRPTVLRLQLHRQPPGRPRGRHGPRRGGRVCRDLRSRLPDRPPGGLGLLPRPSPRTLWRPGERAAGVIATDRLRLRSWRPDDLEAIAAINADPEVGYWLGGPFDAEQSAQF